MKKILYFLTTILMVFSSFQTAFAESITDLATTAGYEVTEEDAPKASILVDVESGQILWAENETEKLDPASTMKLMVVYLALQAVKNGEISLETTITATDTDQEISQLTELSNNNIVSGVDYSLEELITFALVPSSNVGTIMLSHLIFEGSDAEFLKLMNDTAKEFGMNDTEFHNVSGAVASSFNGLYEPEGEDLEAYNSSTAQDLAILATQLLKDFPDVVDFTNDATVTVREGTEYEETFDTYNNALEGAELNIEGVDGLKTGSSPDVGYNNIVTVEREGRRFVVVVLAASEWGKENAQVIRDEFVAGLINYGYDQFTEETILEAGNQKVDDTKIELTTNVTALVQKDGTKPSVSYDKENEVLTIKTDNGYLPGYGGVKAEKVGFPLLLAGIIAGVAILTIIFIVVLIYFIRMQFANRDEE